MNQSRQGYYHHPTVQGEHVVFVSEDDLWSVALGGGIPRRLTSNLGAVSSPRLSPDGRWLAFCGREEGQPDVYVMPAEGGEMRRLTYLGSVLKVAAWLPDSQSLLFLSSHSNSIPLDQPLVYRVSLAGEYPQNFLQCPTRNFALEPRGAGLVLGRNNDDNARWKRYRGGRGGEIWIDCTGERKFQKLHLPQGNPNGPMWINHRIYFVSDHDGIGNIYSCKLNGEDLQPETKHREFYARHASTDGNTIVYQMGGDICALDVASGRDRRIALQWRSPLVQTQRKFSNATRHLEFYHLHPKGHAVALTSRGKIFSMAHWEGAAVQHGVREGARHRLAHWLYDGKRIVAVSDQEDGEEKFVVFSGEPETEPERVFATPPGRIQTLLPSPVAPLVVWATSRLELWSMNLENGETRLLDKNEFAEIGNLAFSHDGQWLAYRKRNAPMQSAIYLCQLQSGAVHRVTAPVLYDMSPSFDPEGRYLYFISTRVLNPFDDTIQYAVGFPGAMKPYLLTLRRDLPNPFIPLPAAPGEESAAAKNGHANGSSTTEKTSTSTEAEKSENKTSEPLRIDLEGIEHRIVEFPVKEGVYRQVLGIKDKVVFTSFPILGRTELGDTSAWQEEEPRGTLWVYDFINQKLETLVSDVSAMQVNPAGKILSYRSGRRIRVLKAGEKPAESSDASTRKTGWLDLGRVKYALDPRAEWRQMFREAWRLQREFFWNENMSGVDWQRVYDRYFPLLERLATRSEFSDLIWEMQGELGTSHAYEEGGDYRSAPYHYIGRLGADFAFDAEQQRYRFTKIYRGDVWMKDCSSPLCGPGVNVNEGDALLAIGGVRLSATLTPGQVLANQAGQEVVLTVQARHETAPRHLTVRTLYSEYWLRYREWVERNRARVAEATAERVGYLHVPDMSTRGLIEFHRYFLAQTSKQALIVDVRYNGGGNVSFMLMEKLMRRPLGFGVKRWGAPLPRPYHSVCGPVVALTNEFAASDGDIFCHSFKFLKVGPLIGKRTWGGVIGIDHRYTLADGGRTTQPQYSFWFSDVQWQVENYGVDPDIEVDFDPGAHLRGEDPQLERGIVEALRLLEEQDAGIPRFEGLPHLPLPS